MKKNLLKSLSKVVLMLSFIALTPVIVLAQFVGPCRVGTYNNGTGCVAPSGLGGLMVKLQSLLNSIIPVLLALGVVYFVWGVVQYMIGNTEEAKTKGRNTIIYGIIGLAIIVGLWGLVYTVVNTFNLDNSNNYAPTRDELKNLLPQ